MVEHTPGPWSLPHFAEPDVNCQCKYVLTDHIMGAVCSVYASGEGDDWASHGDNPKFAEAVANAYLIHAAPDLLAALVRLEQTVRMLPPDMDEPGSPLWQARAAIAKASTTPDTAS